MRFVQMESTTFLVREKSFDPKAFRIQAACLFGSVHIADQIQRLLIAFSPATEEQNGTISFSGHGCLRECDEGARLDIPAHGIEAKSRTVPRRCHVTPRTAHVGPPRRLQRVLQVCAIKFAITKQHHRRTERDQLLYLLDLYRPHASSTPHTHALPGCRRSPAPASARRDEPARFRHRGENRPPP